MAGQWIRRFVGGLLGRGGAADETARIHSHFKKSFGIWFNDPWLLRVALTHRSYPDREGISVSNERLEFLGDSVLGLIASDYLFRSMSDADEGVMTKARSRIVNKTALGKTGMKLGLLDLLLYAREEIRNDDRALLTLSADALEAVIGAIYLDKGFNAACGFVIDRIVDPVSDADSPHATVDHKSRLQEICQARFKTHPDYRIVKRVGPEHRKVFHVEVRIKGETYGFGSGRSRKDAEQVAAGQAILNLSSEDQ
ncbi:MAG: ribonuclease III [Candidatus Eisenbacteria bacterium]